MECGKEHTLVFFKPPNDDLGACITDFLGKVCQEDSLRIIAVENVSLSEELLSEHYVEHEGKPFLAPMCATLTTVEAVPAMVIEGVEAVAKIRRIVGDTYPEKAKSGTIRATYGFTRRGFGGVVFNAIHASDSAEAAKREILLWFPLLHYLFD